MNLNRIVPQPTIDLFTDFSHKLVAEFEANERLKWGLLAVAFVIYMALVLFLSEQASQAKREYSSSQNQLSLLTTQVSETGWPGRAQQAEKMVDELEARFWPGETTGLAEAGFERWVRQRFDQHGTEVRQVQLTRGPALENRSEYYSGTLSDVLIIRAKAIGPLREDALINFLHDAARNPEWIVVEQLIIRSGRNPRFEIDLATFIRTESSSQ